MHICMPIQYHEHDVVYILCLQATHAAGSNSSSELSTPPNSTIMERISEGQEVSFMCLAKL